MLPSAEMLVDTQKCAVDKTSLIRWKIFHFLFVFYTTTTVLHPSKDGIITFKEGQTSL